MGNVNEVLILAKLSVHRLDEENAEGYYRQIEPALREIKGFNGLGLWRGVKSDGSHLAIYAYSDFASADVGLRKIGEIRSLTQVQSVVTAPADVIRARPHAVHGKRITDAAVGSYLSLSDRTSEPGYGAELAEEVERIFDELELMPGCLGAFTGFNDSLEEEVVGLVTWVSEAAYLASVPKRSPYELFLYRRVL